MSGYQKNFIETDVLVVGGGMAGCWAAIRASESGAKVTLVDKGVVARSGTTLYCHDVWASVPEGEEDIWLKEVVEHAQYMSDESYLRILLQESGSRIRDLQDWGVPFASDDSGELIRIQGRGHKTSRVILYDGRKLMEVMRARLVERGICLIQRVMVTDLLTSDGLLPTHAAVVGAVGINVRSGEVFIIEAKAVVIASGVISPKLHFAFADNLTGDGQALALRAGAELGGLEFNSCPTFICPTQGGMIGSTGLIQFQTLGASIVNARNEHFLGEYLQGGEPHLADFGLLGQAIAREILMGRGPVYFDMTGFGPDKFARVRKVIPITMAGLKDGGLDPTSQPVECRPLVGYFGGGGSGGICTDSNGESNITGLMAAGICAQFFGCSEFLSGGTIAACNVFGYRAGERAAKIACQEGDVRIVDHQVRELKAQALAPANRSGIVKPADIFFRLARKFTRLDSSIVKSEATIRGMLKEIRGCIKEDLDRLSASDIHQLIKANEARNFVTVLEAFYLSALERRESRLTHYRLDYPFRDDNKWLKWILVKKENEGLKIEFRPVPVETNRVHPPHRARVPAPVQFPGHLIDKEEGSH